MRLWLLGGWAVCREYFAPSVSSCAEHARRAPSFPLYPTDFRDNGSVAAPLGTIHDLVQRRACASSPSHDWLPRRAYACPPAAIGAGSHRGVGPRLRRRDLRPQVRRARLQPRVEPRAVGWGVERLIRQHVDALLARRPAAVLRLLEHPLHLLCLRGRGGLSSAPETASGSFLLSASISGMIDSRAVAMQSALCK